MPSGTKKKKKKKGFKSRSGKKFSDVEIYESYQTYLKQVKESESFDVDRFPALKDFVGIVGPVPDYDGFREDLTSDGKLSIEHYNKLNSTAYEFVEVLYATYQAAKGIQYFITFTAKEKNAVDTKTFQASVICCMEDVEFELVRLKPPPKQTGDEQVGTSSAMERDAAIAESIQADLMHQISEMYPSEGAAAC